MDLISILSSQLGIDEQQAGGGVGLLLNLAKDKLEGGDFSALQSVIPQAGEFMAQAPEAGGGLLGGLGGLASKLGAGQLGDMAQLAQGFSDLKMDKSMLMQFVPLVLKFVQQQGGDQLKGILEKVLPTG